MGVESHWEDSEYVGDHSTRVFLTTEKLDLNEGVKFVKDAGAGAVISFCGTTRDSFEGKQVTDLSYEAHHKLAVRTLAKIVKECRVQFDDLNKDQRVHKVYVCHRLGVVPVMEDSIIVCLSSTHRQEGWNAAVWLLNKIKERVEIWKAENYIDGASSWKENENSDVMNR
jgi:molybdopterin synthase catalytic subunit